jgi:glycosyltransferase involved in cell wall biosynthesis
MASHPTTPSTTGAPRPGVLMLMPSDPWAPWTMSGYSRQLCLELKRQGALLGALDPNNVQPGSLLGPTWRDRLSQKVQGLATRLGLRTPAPRWSDEREGDMGRFLRSCPANTPVVYAFHSPEPDPSLPIRRIRFMDLSLPDGVKFGSYGFANMPQDEYERMFQNQYRTIHNAVSIVTPSSYAADAIARDFNCDRAKIFPIGGGAAVEFTTPPSVSQTRYQKGEILFVGRDWERKGGPLLLEAFAAVRQAVPHATLTIVGPDNHPAPGHPGVNFVGFLAKDNPAQAARLQQLFLEASLFCMPSVCETWGLVYCEAVVAGLPIVGFHEWALPDIVLNGQSGLLSTERSAQALADNLIQLLRAPQQAAEFAQAGQRYVREVLNWSKVAERLVYAASPQRDALPEPAWLAGDRLRYRGEVAPR